MKKGSFVTAMVLTAGLCTAALGGCAAQKTDSGNGGDTADRLGVSAEAISEESSGSEETAVTSEAESASTAASADLQQTSAEAASDNTASLITSSASEADTAGYPYYGMKSAAAGGNIVMPAPPSWDYYLNPEKTLPAAPEKLKLTQTVKTSNGISLAEQWLEENSLECVDMDEQYSYEPAYGGTYKDGVFGVNDLLELTGHADGEDTLIATLDFSNYVFPDAKQDTEEKEFGEQQVVWARSIGNILYVETGHYTYASTSKGKNAYITAIDMNDMSVIWMSQPLVCNSRNFEIVDGVIVCGYGFTGEKDYLYEISAADGTVMEQIPLKSMADQIICRDNVLYVHTYNTDYQFVISQE